MPRRYKLYWVFTYTADYFEADAVVISWLESSSLRLGRRMRTRRTVDEDFRIINVSRGHPNLLTLLGRGDDIMGDGNQGKEKKKRRVKRVREDVINSTRPY